MILYSLSQTSSAWEFFWPWKNFFLFSFCLYIPEKCYSCWLTAFSVPCTSEMLLIFFSGNFFLQDSLAVNPKNKHIYMASLLISPIDSSLTVAILFLLCVIRPGCLALPWFQHNYAASVLPPWGLPLRWLFPYFPHTINLICKKFVLPS